MKHVLSLLLVTISLFAQPVNIEYNKLLELAVCETGVNYAVAKKSSLMNSVESEFLAVDKSTFDSFSTKQQIAWYSNLYNFYTLKLIVENYPLKSIRDIKTPWDQKIIPLFGKEVSLNHLEHTILRKKYDEPRIHFALNCASIGCPPLRKTPFTGEKLEVQLDEQAQTFLKDESRNRVEGKTLYLSKIFQWYGGDFKKNYGSYQQYAKSVLNITGKMKIKFSEYDWDLNSSTCN